MLSTRGEWFARHEGVRCSTSTPRLVMDNAKWGTGNDTKCEDHNRQNDRVASRTNRVSALNKWLCLFPNRPFFITGTAVHQSPSSTQSSPNAIHYPPRRRRRCPWTDLSCLNDLLWWSPAEPQTPYNNRYVPDHHHHLLGTLYPPSTHTRWIHFHWSVVLILLLL